MNARAYHLGLTGYPLGHSRSPALHNAALRAAGLEGSYDLYPIPPGEAEEAQLAALLEALRAGRLDGLNVTIPHKQRVMACVDALSPVAEAVGAVNTLYARDGKLHGDNTDAPGFLYDLERLWNLPPGDALVLGAGGSARAVVYGLLSRGWRVRVLARRAEQAVRLCEDLSGSVPLGGALFAGKKSVKALRQVSADLVVNATPLGMAPDVEGCPWPEELPLPDGAAVYDLVYNPLETRLASRAAAQGLRAATGLGMLVAQAALAFALWTRTDAPFSVMERAALSGVREGKE